MVHDEKTKMQNKHKQSTKQKAIVTTKQTTKVVQIGLINNAQSTMEKKQMYNQLHNFYQATANLFHAYIQGTAVLSIINNHQQSSNINHD